MMVSDKKKTALQILFNAMQETSGMSPEDVLEYVAGEVRAERAEEIWEAEDTPRKPVMVSLHVMNVDESEPEVQVEVPVEGFTQAPEDVELVRWRSDTYPNLLVYYRRENGSWQGDAVIVLDEVTAESEYLTRLTANKGFADSKMREVALEFFAQTQGSWHDAMSGDVWELCGVGCPEVGDGFECKRVMADIPGEGEPAFWGPGGTYFRASDPWIRWGELLLPAEGTVRA